MPTFIDKEFGEITIRRSRLSRSMRVTVSPDGRLRISVPTLTPVFSIKRMLASSRSELRALVEQQPRMKFVDGMTIGKSHSLHVREGSPLNVSRVGQQIIVTLGGVTIDSAEASSLIRTQVIAALRKEAKHYLPKRLAYLAQKHGYSYTSVRFSHSSGRWGSCTAQGTISLNIALMNLPFELIDYVLFHELAHRRELNHSKKFWQEVEAADPEYLIHRKVLKNHSPSV